MVINPKTIKEVKITGTGLTVEKVVAVARFGAKVIIDDSARKKMEESHAQVEKIVQSEVPTYGINTGFGDFSTVSIAREDISDT